MMFFNGAGNASQTNSLNATLSVTIAEVRANGTAVVRGEKRMLVWNDLEVDEKIKVYDKGVNITNREGVYELLVSYRSGDMWSPQLEQVEALRRELAYFVECISSDQEPFNDGCAGLRVVKMLEAASESLSKRGTLVYL